MPNSFPTRPAAFALLAIAAIASYFMFAPKPSERSTVTYLDGRPIPTDGLLLNPNGLENLDNDVEADFKEIKKWLDKFVAERGQLPLTLEELKTFAGNEADPKIWESRDSEKSHDVTKNNPGGYRWAGWAMFDKGLPRQWDASGNQSAVLLYSDAYVRSNQRAMPDGSLKNKPEGEFVTLWNDGSIRKISFRDRVLAPSGKFEWTYRFRGESGVLKEVVGAYERTEGTWNNPPKS